MSSTGESVLAVLVLTEDTSANATSVIRTIVKKMFGLIAPGCQTNYVDLEPVYEPAARANLWKSTDSKHYRVRVGLFSRVASFLARDDMPCFVLVHFDADCVWDSAPNIENTHLFETRFRKSVRDILAFKRSDLDLNERMTRLVPIVPYYSIESWLYQNTTVAALACRLKGNEEHAQKAEHWGRNRHELDEIEKVKTALCIGSSHNSKLANDRFPTDAVYAVQKSFYGSPQS